MQSAHDLLSRDQSRTTDPPLPISSAMLVEIQSSSPAGLFTLMRILTDGPDHFRSPNNIKPGIRELDQSIGIAREILKRTNQDGTARRPVRLHGTQRRDHRYPVHRNVWDRRGSQVHDLPRARCGCGNPDDFPHHLHERCLSFRYSFTSNTARHCRHVGGSRRQHDEAFFARKGCCLAGSPWKPTPTSRTLR